MVDWIEIGSVNEIPSLGSRVVHANGEEVALFRTANDEIFAVRDRCPHKEGPLSQGIVHGKRVTCPMHNLVLDLGSISNFKVSFSFPQVDLVSNSLPSVITTFIL